MLVEAILVVFSLVSQDVDGLFEGRIGSEIEMLAYQARDVKIDNEAFVGCQSKAVLALFLVAGHLNAHNHRLLHLLALFRGVAHEIDGLDQLQIEIVLVFAEFDEGEVEILSGDDDEIN